MTTSPFSTMVYFGISTESCMILWFRHIHESYSDCLYRLLIEFVYKHESLKNDAECSYLLCAYCLIHSLHFQLSCCFISPLRRIRCYCLVRIYCNYPHVRSFQRWHCLQTNYIMTQSTLTREYILLNLTRFYIRAVSSIGFFSTWHFADNMQKKLDQDLVFTRTELTYNLIIKFLSTISKTIRQRDPIHTFECNSQLNLWKRSLWQWFVLSKKNLSGKNIDFWFYVWFNL